MTRIATGTTRSRLRAKLAGPLSVGAARSFSDSRFLRSLTLTIQNIQLRKLLKIGFAEQNRRRSELKKDIREERARLTGEPNEGGDFYVPFWADAKAHVFGALDLHQAVTDRIADNWRRKNLYPRLRDGFFLWWGDRRRWTNEPFQLGRPLKARFAVPGLAATVKIDSMLSIQDGTGAHHYIYPYFAPEPELRDDAARVGLWLLGQALPQVPHREIRILDIIRGRPFSVDQTPLLGDEEQRFQRMYEGLINERDTLQRGSA